MNKYSYKIADSLYLIQQQISQSSPVKPVATAINHIVVIDCSGSMAYDLPKIREQLKKKLPKMLKDTDTISIIWFSGKGQYGVLLEAEPVATLTDLTTVNQAIDRWLKPVGLTGFREPLEEVSALVNRVSKKSKHPYSLFFMSDGCDNQWPRADILRAIEQSSSKLASATFVEYGYYADRPLLSSMAEKAGGSLIFSEDFDKYSPIFEQVLTKKMSGANRIESSVAGDVICQFGFALQDGDLLTFEVSNGKVLVPSDLREFFYLSPSVLIGQNKSDLATISKEISSTKSGDTDILAAAYAAISLFSTRMKSDVVLSLLKAVGDIKFIEQFSGLFGKQKYSEFMEMSRSAAFGLGRFEKGWDPTRIPRDDAFTVLQLLRILSEDDSNKVLLDHPEFVYTKIGRGRVDAAETLTEDDLDEIKKLTIQMASVKDLKSIQAIQDQIAKITSNKHESLKFITDKHDDGYSISSLTFNEDRPNISILIKKFGTIDLSNRLPSEFQGKLPEKFKSFQFRNYAIVRDGLVNVKMLPVRLSEETRKKLESGLQDGLIPKTTLEIDTTTNVAKIHLDTLPIINRKMVNEVSAKHLFEREYELAKARGAQKVYKAFKNERFPRKSEGFSVQYGDTAATWLKDQGITDYSGFSPKTTQAESTDYYMGKELKISLAKLSSLPTVEKVREMIAKNKITPSGSLMVPALREVDDFLSSSIYNKAADKDKLFEAWLDGQTKDAVVKVRNLLFELAQIKFSIIVGQIWFKEFSSLDENSLSIVVDGNTIDCSVNMKDVEIKI